MNGIYMKSDVGPITVKHFSYYTIFIDRQSGSSPYRVLITYSTRVVATGNLVSCTKRDRGLPLSGEGRGKI